MRIGDLSVWPQRDWKDRSFPFWLNVFITDRPEELKNRSAWVMTQLFFLCVISASSAFRR